MRLRPMRPARLIGIGLCLWILPASGAVTENVQGNFSVRLPDGAMRFSPAVKDLRLLERVVRLMGRFDGGASGRPFLLVLDERLAPGEWRWEGAGANRALHVPADHEQWAAAPRLGREIVTGLIQSRLNLEPGSARPHWPDWVADGLWAGFQAFREDDLQLLRMVWLPMLRGAAARGGRVGLTAENLKNGMDELGAPAAALYRERACLMVAVSGRLSGGRQNLLADYLDLMRRQAAAPEECFRAVFGEAAQKSGRSALKLSGAAPDGGDEADALEYQALRTLFSLYAPLPGEAAVLRLEEIGRVTYRREEGGPEAVAALEDLPWLVSQYPSCASLPRRKIQELNQLAAMVPMELRGEIFAVTAALAGAGRSTTAPAEEIRRRWEALRKKALWLRRVDELLERWEYPRRPLLLDFHLVLDPASRRTRLPERLRRLLERAEE